MHASRKIKENLGVRGNWKRGVWVLILFCSVALFPFFSFGQTQQPFRDDSTQSDTTPPKKYVPKTRPDNQIRDRRGDPFSNKGQTSPLLKNQPSNIKTEVELDTNDNTYTIYEKVGEMDYRPASSMTFEEYSKYREREVMRNYMKAKGGGEGGTGQLANNRLIPKIFLNPALSNIFGGNTVDIRPNGSVMLDFGFLNQQVFNPALPIQQQNQFQFLFDQQINLNVQGKVGEKLKLTVNYDTKANFDFDNNIKLEYTSLDHEILQKVEAGNVSLPLSNSLITGAQNLFGVKTIMKFGNLKVTSVASIQRGKQERLVLRGGSQTRDIQIRADNYDANRHFFLSQFFANQFEAGLRNPAINPPPTGVLIGRVEVYITNRANNTATLRNMAAFADLGESRPANTARRQSDGQFKVNVIGSRDPNRPSSNAVNSIYPDMSRDQLIRNADNTAQRLDNFYEFSRSDDYEVIRGARRLTDMDFTFHPQLGYISLRTPLRDDEVLAVAYQYTYNGQVYKVGELTEDYQALPPTDVILLKLLRPAKNNYTNLPMWRLQMKNIYSLDASSINREGFQLRIIYRDDSSGVDNPALRQGRRIRNKQLVEVFNLDRLNPVNELQPDGNFDFIEGITINSRDGKIIFPVEEPFGRTLAAQFDNDENLYRNRYVFNELYTQVQADARQAANKNKFFLVGRMQSSSSADIQLPGINIAPGSVRVTVGGRPLSENSDYTVDYQLGRVRISNTGVMASGDEVEIKYERADLFNFQQRSFFGTRLDYQVNKDITIGGTLLFLDERPLIRRVAVGEEPTTNLLWGIDVNYKKDSRALTKLIDMLPMIQTKEVSNITFQGEYARLHPGSSGFVDPSGAGVSYIDDFEGVRTPTDLGRQSLLWRIAATPVGKENPVGGKFATNDLRAKMAWYNIDQVFYRTAGGLRPSNISDEDLKNNFVRPIGPQEVFPNRDLQAVNLNELTLDLAYYPEERGPYNMTTNLNPDGTMRNPRQNWAGIQRAFTTNTDFNAVNVEFVEFWMMNPFRGGGAKGQISTIYPDGNVRTFPASNNRSGVLHIDLGAISEDVLRDNRHSYENGLPTPGQQASTDETPLGRVPRLTPIVPAFDNRPGSRAAQDIGLDGLTDEDERNFYRLDNNQPWADAIAQTITDPLARDKFLADPSADNFGYYLGGDKDAVRAGVLDRYKDFNGQQGNSPETTSGTFTPSSYPLPDNEDLNNDLTLNELNQYFSYAVKINPEELSVGRNYVVDKIEVPNEDSEWLLMRIPIRDLNHPNGVKTIGGIDNFNNMRFIRVWMDGFQEPVVLRMVQFQLVASTWRQYTKQLTPRRPVSDDEPDGALVLASVNVEENGYPVPGKVPYVVPPNISRDRDVTSGVNRRLNEQSLALCVDRLRDNDAKAAFKNVPRIDFLNYGKMKMFISAHTFAPNTTKDNDVAAFIRIGTDFEENYYEVEIPLLLTPTNGNPNPFEVWRVENELDIELNDLYGAKVARNFNRVPMAMAYGIYNVRGTRQNVYVVGNPDLNNANVLMVGVRNLRGDRTGPKSICVWFNELRVTDFIKNDGWATTGRLNLKLADLGNLTLSGKYVSPGFGSIEQRISERTRDVSWKYSAATNLQLDRFLPKVVGVKLPMYASIEQTVIDPQYDPLNPDIRMDATLSQFRSDPTNAERAELYRSMVRDQTIRRSINFTNIQRQKQNPTSRLYPWDIENLSFTYAYSEQLRSNITILDNTLRNYRYALGYNYAFTGGAIEPFKNSKSKILGSPWMKWLKDFNLNLLPNMVTVRGEFDRMFARNQLRSADIFGEGLLPTFEKSFTFNRNYGLRFAPFKSLTLDYTANAQAIIDEPPGEETQFARDSIWRNIQRFGRVRVFNQTVRGNYKLPLDKIPLTDWLTADVTYAAGTNWLAAPTVLQDTLGNQLQNNRERQLNGQINFLKLYNKIKWLNAINNPAPAPAKPKTEPPKLKPGEKDTTKKKRDYAALKGLVRLLMSVRNANFAYTVTENTSLPGFIPTPDFVGLNTGLMAPGIPFILGDQDPNIRFTAAENGWLGRSRLQNMPFMQSRTENLTGRLTLEPFRDMRVQLDAKMSNMANYSEIFRDSNSIKTINPNFQSFNPGRGGSYSISYIAIGSAFLGGNDANNKNEAFRRLEQYRGILFNRLQSEFEANRDRILRTTNDTNLLTRPDLVRFDSSSQDVLLPAFLAAYSGQDPNRIGLSAFPRIPLPNWRFDYAGLTKIPFFANIFQSVNVTHAYTSNYTVGSYSANLVYGGDVFSLDRDLTQFQMPTQTVTNGRDARVFSPSLIINTANLNERFSPLIGINVRTKNKITLRFDYNRDRNITFNMSNAQITEMSGQDVTFGGGFAQSGLKLPFRVQGRQVVLENELQTRLDITLRDSETVQRQLDQINTITMGIQDIQIKPSINYMINQRLNVQAYYEYSQSNPKISTSFRRIQQRFGVQLRFTLM